MAQNALSVVTPIKADQVDALESLLDAIGGDIRHNALIPFEQLTTLHFACWVVLKRDPNFAPCLVWETNFDGSPDAHLDEWLACAAPGLNAIYAHCQGCPAEAAAEPLRLRQFLLAHRVLEAAFYIGCYDRSLPVIQNAIATRQAIEDFLDREQAAHTLDDLTPRDIYERVRAGLQKPTNGHAALPTLTSPSAASHHALVTRSRLALALWILAGVALLPLALPFLLFYVPLLRRHEMQEAAAPGPPSLGVDTRLFGKEDIWTQNHLTTLTNVKPGKFRLRTLKGVLWIINKLARAVFITGSLGGIPTIHFARWLLIDNDRRLLFFSNYDGSWASYLGDFVDKANYGLTSVWSNTDNFPPTRFLFFGGAQHIEQFKAWSRNSNEYAAVWYSAYPDATVRNITDMVQTSETLNAAPTDREIEAWLQKL